MVLSKGLVSWYVVISDSAVVSYLNVLSHLRFNVIRTSLWKNLFLLCLGYCSSQDGKANQTGYNENYKNHLQEAVFVREVKGSITFHFALYF